MECHRCPHREDMAAGKYANTAFAETPCAQCELREVSLRTLAVDPERPAFVPGQNGAADGTCEMVPFPGEVVAPEAKLPVDVMEEFVVRLLELPQDVRDVVCWRFVGLDYREIAQKQQITTAGAEARHRRAMRQFPELRQLFTVKTARRKTRCRAAARAAQTASAAGA